LKPLNGYHSLPGPVNAGDPEHCPPWFSDGGREEPTPMTTPPPETVYVDETVVACDGGGALGHPRVYLNMGPNGVVECPYCDRRFVLRRSQPETGTG